MIATSTTWFHQGSAAPERDDPTFSVLGPQCRDRGLVFPGVQGGMVGAAVFGRLLKDLKIDCSPHGFRSSFRSWCSDEGIDRELAEQV